MLNPSVGEIESMSSPLNFFKIVVFPALSKPLQEKKKKRKHKKEERINERMNE